jgi:AcrR family transcriptional regulator
LLKLIEVKSLDQITIRDIAAKAGVGYTTFFRHCQTKEALLADVAAEQIAFLINLSLRVMDTRDLHAASVALFTYVDDHRPLWSTLLAGGAAGTIREEFLRLARVAAASRTRPDGWFPAEVGVILIVSGTIELLAWWLRQSDPLPIERIAEIHDRIVVSPAIVARSAGRRRRGE